MKEKEENRNFKLSDHNDQNAFKVPNGYFENNLNKLDAIFQEKQDDTFKEPEKEKRGLGSIIFLNQYTWIGIAASLMLVLAINEMRTITDGLNSNIPSSNLTASNEDLQEIEYVEQPTPLEVVENVESIEIISSANHFAGEEELYSSLGIDEDYTDELQILYSDGDELAVEESEGVNLDYDNMTIGEMEDDLYGYFGADNIYDDLITL